MDFLVVVVVVLVEVFLGFLFVCFETETGSNASNTNLELTM